MVEQLPAVGRVFFGAHLAMPRPDDPLLSGWHAVNCLREWRGDTHWALVVAAGLTDAEASILHNAWLGYEPDWLADVPGQRRPTRSRPAGRRWRRRAWPATGEVTDEGVALRQRIEDDTDRLTTLPWELLGEARSIEFAERFEPPCELLLRPRRRDRRARTTSRRRGSAGERP